MATSPVPMLARLTAIEIVGHLEEKSSTTRPDHFVIVSVDDKKVAKSDTKGRVPAPGWKWQEVLRFPFNPSSTIKIEIYRQSRLLGSYIQVMNHLVGQHSGKIVDLLERDTTVDLTDKTGSGIAARFKIGLSLVSTPENNLESLIELVNTDVSRLDSSSRATSVFSVLGSTLELTKGIMDIVGDAHPILKISSTVIFSVYTAVKRTKLQDNAIRDLAESLREVLGVANERPNLPLIKGTTNVTEEIGRTSLKVVSLIHEYTIPSFTGRLFHSLPSGMKSRIEQCQISCDDLKKKFDTRLNMDVHRQGERTERAVEEIKVDLKTIKDDQQAKKIYEWLSPPDSSKNHNEAREKHQTGTCSWFLDGPRFRDLQEKGGLLWIKGTVGSGKTILCSSIIERIIELHKDSSTAYAYFFFDGRDLQKDLQLHDKLIRSLIVQLSHQCNGIPAPLIELYGHGLHQPSTSSLQNILHSMIDGLQSTYIIIDSLDECAETKKLLEWIAQIISHKMSNLHMVVSSRPERDISDILQSLDPHYVDLVGHPDNHDIELYINHQFKLETKWGEQTLEMIKSKLIRGAQGMFQWVALQVMELKGCSSEWAIKERLDMLPKGLDATYDQILSKISEPDRTDSKTFLRWLSFANRPMTLTEIAETIVVDCDATTGAQYVPSRRYLDECDVLKKCAGLITESEGCVKLAHLSLRDYLISERLRMAAGAISYFHLAEELSHGLISQTCLAYLLQFDKTKSFPLANYAAENWIFHAQLGGIDKSEQSFMLTLALDLFSQETVFTSWVCLWDLDQYHSSVVGIGMEADIPPPLYYASRAGLQQVTKHLLEKGNVHVNKQGGLYGNALRAAIFQNHESIVKLLLENGADMSAREGDGVSALQDAVLERNEAITKLLLEKGADPNAQAGFWGNALQEASAIGHKAIVTLLLHNRADVNAEGGHYGNALQAASFEGHEDIVKLLLVQKANVNAQGGKYGSALQAASFEGHKEIVKLLLRNGAEVNAQGGDAGNALRAALLTRRVDIMKLLLENGANANAKAHWEGYFVYGKALQEASFIGHEAIVELLVDYGAEVNGQGGQYGTALQAASLGGYEAIVELLLRKGANVDAQGEVSGTALQAASFIGHQAIVNLLLAKKADANVQGGYYGNALQAASAKGHYAIAKHLLERGADVNAQGGHFGHALQAASAEGYEAIVNLLLVKKANVNVQGGYYGNALQAASSGGHKAIVKLLLDQGADANAKGGIFGNALQAASSRGHEGVVMLLLNKGADTNARAGTYANALQAASFGGHEGLVKLLLDKGADVNSQGGDYGSALQAAASIGHSAIVKLLLQKGADVNTEGGYYGNALQAASFQGHKAIAKLLLEKGANRDAPGHHGNALHTALDAVVEVVEKLL